jgi:hypothetical protein
MESKVQGGWGGGGGNVKGIGKLHSLWDYKTLQIGIHHWTLEGFEFCFLIHVDGDLGTI